MPKYRSALPQLEGDVFLSDGGLETVMVFQRGFDLPEFAAFDMLKDEKGKTALRDYYRTYAQLACKYGVNFVLESATWRASRDWADKLGYTAAGLAKANREAIELLAKLRDAYEADGAPIVISGCIGPRGDGYDPGALATPDEAQAYHGEQIRTFLEADSLGYLSQEGLVGNRLLKGGFCTYCFNGITRISRR